MTYSEWCAERGCEHAHCPMECEHPQPFVDAVGRLLCGRCVHIEDRETEMIPCTPETCKE